MSVISYWILQIYTSHSLFVKKRPLVCVDVSNPPYLTQLLVWIGTGVNSPHLEQQDFISDMRKDDTLLDSGIILTSLKILRSAFPASCRTPHR